MLLSSLALGSSGIGKFRSLTLLPLWTGISVLWITEVNLPELHDRDAIKDALRDIGMPENSNRMNAGQLFRFAEVAKEGELVALPVSGDSIVKIGRFSDNTLERDDDFDEKYVHVRRVEWIKEVQRDEFSQQSRNTLGSFTTFCRGGVHLFEEVETLLAGKVVAKRSINEDRTDIPEHEMEFAFEKYLENFILND